MIARYTRLCSNVRVSRSSYHRFSSNSSSLVDDLLSRTAQLMEQDGNNNTTHHVVAFSGGVDSSLVAYLVHTLDSANSTAALGISPAVSTEQRAAALAMANHIGIPLQTVETNEIHDPVYIANQGQACYACKTHLYRTLHSIYHHHHHKNAATTTTLYNGTNADDLHDSTRSGLRAAAEWNCQSPLANVPKAHVREAAAIVGLPNAYTAASPCLRSRLQWGVEATQEHLRITEKAETFVRDRMQWAFATSAVNLRVRLFSGQRACVQVDKEYLGELLRVYEVNKEEWDGVFLDELGFRSLEIRPFKSGSAASFGDKVQVTRHTHM